VNFRLWVKAKNSFFPRKRLVRGEVFVDKSLYLLYSGNIIGLCIR
jgi:hypothetical protein